MQILKWSAAVLMLAAVAGAAAQERPDHKDKPTDRKDRPKADRPKADADDRHAERGERHDDFRRPAHWRRGSELGGVRLRSTNNTNIGRFEDFVIDPATGRIVYGVVVRDDAGDRGKLYPIPWSAIHPGAGDRKDGFSVEFEGTRLSGAPSFPTSEWPNSTNQAWSETVYRHYDVDPYWKHPPRSAGERDPRPGVTTYRETWYRYPASWSRLSQLRSVPVRNQQDQQVGQLSDVAIDPSTGRILYGVVTKDSKLYAVPWTALSLGPSGQFAMVKVGNDPFDEKYAFTNQDWPDMTDRTWTDETYRRFRVEPYWDE